MYKPMGISAERDLAVEMLAIKNTEKLNVLKEHTG